MRAGLSFKAQVEGVAVGVIYTSHFVERYHADVPNRPAAARSVSEESVRQAVEAALPVIVDYQAGDPSLSGVIVSKGLKLNMSFETKPKSSGGFTLVMKNMMVKVGYKPTGFKDYIIEVNPSYRVDFPRATDRELRVAVLDDLPLQVPHLEDGEVYDVKTPEASYVVERDGDRLHIHDADWSEDMLYVDVA